MHCVRPIVAEHPTRFGRAPLRPTSDAPRDGSTIASDIKLFIATFAAGFLFVSILFA